MTDWLTNKGLGPWAFAKQPNKWGYLNNPNWVNDGVAPISYDGVESTEPQVWSIVPPNNVRTRGSQDIHNPCGHWHNGDEYTPPEPPTPPVEYVPWWSCPMGILPHIEGNDILFFTTDGDLISGLVDTPRMFLDLYTDSTGLWSNLLERLVTVDGRGDAWAEPNVGIAWKGSIRVMVSLRYYNLLGTNHDVQVLVYDGATLLNNTILDGTAGATYGKYYQYDAHTNLAFIDNLGYIHILVKVNDGGTYKIKDFISTDNGATFSVVTVYTPVTTAETYTKHLLQANDNTLYAIYRKEFKTSTNNGATWSSATAIVVDSNVNIPLSYAKYVNGVFLGIIPDPTTVNNLKIAKSADCATWSSVQTFANRPKLSGVDITHDGTYYYLALQYRNTAVAIDDGYTEIYRSADATTWTLVATILDDGHLASYVNLGVTAPIILHPVQIFSVGSTLFFSFYYAETILSGQPTVFLMTYWKSVDSGVTWTPIQTRFYDLTHPSGTAPV